MITATVTLTRTHVLLYHGRPGFWELKTPGHASAGCILHHDAPGPGALPGREAELRDQVAARLGTQPEHVCLREQARRYLVVPDNYAYDVWTAAA